MVLNRLMELTPHVGLAALERFISADVTDASYARELCAEQRNRIAQKDTTQRVWMINLTLVDGEAHTRAAKALTRFLKYSDEAIAECAQILGFPEFEVIEVARRA